MTVLKVIFSNKDPLLAYHMLKTEIPYNTVIEYLEMLDVYEALKEQADREAQERIKAAQNKK